VEDKRRTSAAKSVVWRVMGVVILGAITYGFTGSWMQTGAITFIHHGAFLLIYYLHERAWIWLKRTRPLGYLSVHRAFFRPVFYEIILGHLVLGLITLCVTGSWLAVSLITPTYILNKLWVYVVFDKLWEKGRVARFINKESEASG